jgi:hypothetical protein
MKIDFVFTDKNNQQRTVTFEGTPEECAVAERWPSFVANGEYGQKLIRRFAADPAQEALETFCCQSG